MWLSIVVCKFCPKTTSELRCRWYVVVGEALLTFRGSVGGHAQCTCVLWRHERCCLAKRCLEICPAGHSRHVLTSLKWTIQIIMISKSKFVLVCPVKKIVFNKFFDLFSNAFLPILRSLLIYFKWLNGTIWKSKMKCFYLV